MEQRCTTVRRVQLSRCSTEVCDAPQGKVLVYGKTDGRRVAPPMESWMGMTTLACAAAAKPRPTTAYACG